MAAPARRGEEADILDVVHLFKDGKSISEIARKLTSEKGAGVSRHRVVALLQRAFQNELVSLSSPDATRLQGQLADQFEDVQFQVLSSRLRFPSLAAQQALRWIRESCPGPAPSAGDQGAGPFVAVGGGRAIAGLVKAVPRAVKNCEREDPDLREWLTRANLTFINATAGGLATSPELEASFLTCRFAQAIRESCGETAGARAVVHSVSLFPSPDEHQVVHDGLRHTRAVVSGVGDRDDAYCISAIRKKGLLSQPDQEQIAGELLFHPFNGQAQPIHVPGIAVKKRLQAGEETARGVKKKKGEGGRPESSRPESPMLATLFDFDDLRGRPTKAGLSVIVVASCSPDNREKKARAVAVLLEHRFITHLCVSADLAREVLRTLSRRDL